MLPDPPFPCSTVAVIATMHAKERAIAPVLLRKLELAATVAPGFDTDRFGTFSREIERVGSQLDAARAKIAAAFEVVPSVRMGWRARAASDRTRRSHSCRWAASSSCLSTARRGWSSPVMTQAPKPISLTSFAPRRTRHWPLRASAGFRRTA